MVKIVILEVTTDVPITEIGKTATLTVETRTYQTRVIAVSTLEDIKFETSKVTLEGVGLKTS